MIHTTRYKNVCAELSAGTHPSSHNLCLKVKVKLFHVKIEEKKCKKLSRQTGGLWWRFVQGTNCCNVAVLKLSRQCPAFSLAGPSTMTNYNLGSLHTTYPNNTLTNVLYNHQATHTFIHSQMFHCATFQQLQGSSNLFSFIQLEQFKIHSTWDYE